MPEWLHYYWKINDSWILAKEYKMHEDDWSEIIKGILSGLKYIHDDHELMHRDIKPGNILLSQSNLNFYPIDVSKELGYDVKICDFGLSSNVGRNIYELNNKAGGTLLFQAPEQALWVSYSKPIDVWAWGFIMYYLLSFGKHPVSDKNFNLKNSK